MIASEGKPGLNPEKGEDWVERGSDGVAGSSVSWPVQQSLLVEDFHTG